MNTRGPLLYKKNIFFSLKQSVKEECGFDVIPGRKGQKGLWADFLSFFLFLIKKFLIMWEYFGKI